MSLSKNYSFLVMSSPGGPGMVNGQILPENALQMTTAALSILA